MPESPKTTTLLAHLVLKFAPHPENVAVDALGHILARSATAREALSDLLRDAGADVGPLARVTTQATSEGRERPDLAAVDDRGRERLLIEAKFWAGLTENQPVAYLERLPAGVTSALLVVGPEARRVSLWAELRELVQEAEGLAWQDATTTPELRSADIGRGRKLVLTSWGALLGRMASRASGAHEADVELDIGQLRGLADRMDGEAFLPLRSEELGLEMPRRVLNFNALLDDAFTMATDAGALRAVSPVTSTTDRRGGRVRIAGTRAWFGIGYDLWARHRPTPLWLRFWDWKGDPDPVDVEFSEARRRLAPLGQSDPPGLIEGASIDRSGDLLAPIMLPTGVEYEAVLDAVVARLTDVAALLADEPE